MYMHSATNKLLTTMVFRAARFNSVHHLSILFPNNFGAETTKVYYIGLRGDFMEVCSSRVLRLHHC